VYKTCIYCNRNLGDNEVVEDFPVGRRLAFDGEKGRLWVICEHCRRWNLSPLEERWEAIEECERQFYDTPKSFSTDNIGLAQLAEGLQLVRIGRPQRREFAAWRYGRQFLRRRIKSLAIWGVKLGAMVAAAASGVFVFHLFTEQQEKIVARIRSADGRRMFVPLKDAKKTRLILAPERDNGWMLSVPYRDEQRNWGILGAWAKGKRKITELEGPIAIRAAGRIMPGVNSFGGSSSQVQNAVRLIEDARGPERFFHSSARVQGKERLRYSVVKVEASEVGRMDATTRLALEMAAHEETERRAFEGELAQLEEAWREAEEIASIADRLLIPESVEKWIRKHRGSVISDQS
jgi:hypothetical protein